MFLSPCFQDRLRKSEALQDELSKFLLEHGSLGSWLEQSEQEMHSLGEGETDAQGLKDRLEEHRKVHKKCQLINWWNKPHLWTSVKCKTVLRSKKWNIENTKNICFSFRAKLALSFLLYLWWKIYIFMLATAIQQLLSEKNTLYRFLLSRGHELGSVMPLLCLLLLLKKENRLKNITHCKKCRS